MEDEFVDMCVELVSVPNGFDAEAGHRFVDETEPRALMAGSLAAHPVGWRSSFRNDARFDPEAPMRGRSHGDDEEWAEVYEALHDEAGTQVAEMHAGVAYIDALPSEERDRYWAAVRGDRALVRRCPGTGAAG